MSFDCTQCLNKCHADCCRGPVPLRAEWVERHAPVREVLERKDMGEGWVVMLAVDDATLNAEDKTVMGVCAYLGHDNRCSVYHDRPEVCREFGSESNPWMVCSYQDKTGRVRSRQERRHIERVMFAERDRLLEKLQG